MQLEVARWMQHDKVTQLALPARYFGHQMVQVPARLVRDGVPGVNVKKTSRVGNSLSHNAFFVSPRTFICVSVLVLLFLDR